MSETSEKSLPTLAILGGTGKEGPGLAMRWATAGYPIIIGSRLLERAQATATELNEKLRTSIIQGMENEDAAMQADICVLTVVHSAHQSALSSLKKALQGKILVDATARVDFRDPKPPAPPSAAEIAQEILGEGVRVVAAFQNVPAHALKKNLGERLDLDVLVCANDESAADEVIKLAEASGMQGYYCGGLENGVVVEGLASILISLNRRYNVKTASIRVSGI